MLHTINVRVTHKKADVSILEIFSFPDIRKALREIYSLDFVKECVVIQTCNRVEVYVAAEDVSDAYKAVVDYLRRHTFNRLKEKKKDLTVDEIIEESRKFHEVIETSFHQDALRHLLRLTSGLESMIIGENQILGQVREAFKIAKEEGTVGQFFEIIFQKALNVGSKVRCGTNISKGAVSIGSAAVELAKEVLGGLENKVAMLIGAGEMGTLIAKHLVENSISKLIIANRTYEKALKLAKELKGEAIPLNEIKKYIKSCDLAITSTSAKEPIITRETLEGCRKIVLIDVSIPRNIHEDVKEIEGVELFDIDSLREIAERNKKAREREAIKAEEIIEEELDLLIKQIYHTDVDDIIKAIFKRAEHIRTKELEKALRMLGDGINDKEREIIDTLTRVIIKKTFIPIAENLRKAAEIGDKEKIEIVRKFFLEDLRHKGDKLVSTKKVEKA